MNMKYLHGLQGLKGEVKEERLTNKLYWCKIKYVFN